MNELVRSVLARRHPARDAGAIRPWHRLERDLGMTPLELVLIALKVEEIEGVELPVEDLSTLRTVEELVSFLTRAVLYSQRWPRGSVEAVAQRL